MIENSPLDWYSLEYDYNSGNTLLKISIDLSQISSSWLTDIMNKLSQYLDDKILEESYRNEEVIKDTQMSLDSII